MQVNVYLNFTGNTEEAFESYRSVLGREFASVVPSMPIADQLWGDY